MSTARSVRVLAATLLLWVSASAACAADLTSGSLKDSDKVALNLKNVDLTRVIELLTHDRGLNIVAAPEVNRKISVRLQGVNWRDALDVILRQSGMGMEITGNIIRIDTIDRIQSSPVRQEYTIRYLGKADADALFKTVILPPASWQIVETPADPGAKPLLTAIVYATGPDQEKLAKLLERVDVASRARPVLVRSVAPGLYAVDIDDMPVTDALEQLGKQLGFSVIWEDPAKGRTRVKLARVSVPEALTAVLTPLGYAFEIAGHVLRVGERGKFQNQTRTRLFKLCFANPLHVKAVLTPILTRTGKIEVLGDVRDDNSSTGLGNGAATTVAQGNGANTTTTQNGITRVGGGQRGRTTTALTRQQPPSGTLLVSDTPQVLDQVDQLICELDHPQPQVEIETKLVEVTLTKETQLGIKWDAQIAASGATGNAVRFPLTLAQVNNPAVTSANNTFTLGTLSAQNFTVLLHALAHDNKVKVLSSPRISTQSHEPARILVGQRFPITVQTANAAVNINTTTLDYYEDIGIALTVTPRVTAKDLINLAIKPEVSSIASLIDNRFPVIDTREAETRVVLKSGHTAVIGGLLQDRTEHDDQGLPGLGKLPIVGRLFNLHGVKRLRTELLVCVTPRVVATPYDDAAGPGSHEDRVELPQLAGKPRPQAHGPPEF